MVAPSPPRFQGPKSLIEVNFGTGAGSGLMTRYASAGRDVRRAGQDLGPWVGRPPAGFNDRMFVRDEVRLDLGFPAAQARLASLASSGFLLRASDSAYGEGTTGLTRVGPLGSVRGMSKLVEVRYRDLVADQDSARLPFRWEATGPGGALFPALDADITLTPDGEHATVLNVTGVYRPPAGALGAGLDRAILCRVADATIRAFVGLLAEAVAHPASRPAGQPEPPPVITGQDKSWLPYAAETP